MREFGKLAPTFWTRGSGRLLRGHQEAQIVACYLFSCGASNMIGVYYLLLQTLAAETGLTIEGARKGLGRVSEVGIAHYDESAELVWLPNLAFMSVGGEVVVKDKRHKAIERELDQVGNHPFAKAFYDKYREAFHLRRRPELEGLASPLDAPSQAPSKPEQSRAEKEQKKTAAATDLSSIRAALNHPSFANVPDLDAVAQDRCDRFGTLQITKPGFHLEWFLAAIGEAASDCAGTGLSAEAKVRKLRTYTHNPKPPKRDDNGETPDQILQRKNREGQEVRQ